MRPFVIIILSFFSACSNNSSSKNILKPEKMQAVLWDYLRADTYANENLRQDTMLNVELESAKLQQKVFLKHKITKEQFYNSLNYYMDHKDEMKDILDTILVRQQKQAVLPIKAVEDTSRLKGVLSRKKMIDTIKLAE